MKSFLVYKFACGSSSSSYIGETCRHFKTRIEENIKKDNKCHIFKHLHSTATCFDSYNSLCFKIIDIANSKFYIKIKEVYILTGKNLTSMHNKIISLSPFHYSLCFPCCFLSLFVSLLLIFAFFFHLLFSLSLR